MVSVMLVKSFAIGFVSTDPPSLTSLISSFCFVKFGLVKSSKEEFDVR
jgi:hypothetical protein